MRGLDTYMSQNHPLNSHYGDRDGLLVLSYNAITTIVNSNRNYGKTWTFKKRAVRRFLKHGNKTIWLRIFKTEAKECVRKFFEPGVLKYCGLEWYDKKTKKGNLKQEGNTFYIRRGKVWDSVIFVYALCDKEALRGADDVAIDTIVLDEYSKTPSSLRRYRGNMVTDFYDIFISAKREHEVRAVLLGNLEAYANPFLAYFGIQPPPRQWNGIRSYKDGTIVIQQIDNKPKSSDYENRLAKMFKGTAYGDYLYEGAVKGSKKVRIKKRPPYAYLYAQVDFKGGKFAIYGDNGYYWFDKKIQKSQPVFTDVMADKYGTQQRRLVNRSKNLFNALSSAIQMGHVYFTNEALSEAVEPFMLFLGCV